MSSGNAVLSWHFIANLYPPISDAFIPVAERAIELAALGELDTPVDMPNGLTHSAGEIMEDLRLWDFVETEEDADGEPDGEPIGE